MINSKEEFMTSLDDLKSREDEDMQRCAELSEWAEANGHEDCAAILRHAGKEDHKHFEHMSDIISEMKKHHNE